MENYLNKDSLPALLPWGIKSPFLFTTLNLMGGVFLPFDVSMDISQGKFISGKSSHKHHTNNGCDACD